MSNAPDRLDGFHYNRCCRKKTDKGRSDANLASYSKDRRAFENWSDGNWITANMLMGYIKSNPALRQEPCANFPVMPTNTHYLAMRNSYWTYFIRLLSQTRISITMFSL